MHITSVFTVITARKPMLVEKLFCAASNELPVLPVIRHAKTLKKNIATDWKKLLTFVMDALKRSVAIPLLTSMVITHALQTESIVKRRRNLKSISA